MPGPCDPEDLLDGVIFGAKYLGSTQLQSEKNPSTNARMAQAQEAMDRIKVEKYYLFKKKKKNYLNFNFQVLFAKESIPTGFNDKDYFCRPLL